jgi:hypothetical protein
MGGPSDSLGDQPRSAGLTRGKGGKGGKKSRGASEPPTDRDHDYICVVSGPCVSCAVTMDSRWRPDPDGRDMCGRCYDRCVPPGLSCAIRPSRAGAAKPRGQCVQ